MSAGKTLTETKVEDLEVGQTVVFRMNSGNQLFTLLTGIEHDGSPTNYDMFLMAFDDAGELHEFIEPVLYNQIVMVLS